jgi:hypothetical protein
MSRGIHTLIAAGPIVAAYLLLGGCETPPAASPAAPEAAATTTPPNPADVAYCNKLASLYDHYGEMQSRSGNEVDVGTAEAMNQCHHGNPQLGIASLERRLKEQRISLPPR